MGADVSKKKKKKISNVYAYKMKLINKVKTMVPVALSSCYLYFFFFRFVSFIGCLRSLLRTTQRHTHNIERKLEGGTRSAATNLSYRGTQTEKFVEKETILLLFFFVF